MSRKYSFGKGHDSEITWPLTSAGLAALGATELVSPRVGNTHGYADPVPTRELLHAEMEDVERVRYEVDKNIWPGWWLEKYDIDPVLSPALKSQLRLRESNPKQCANVVRMDHPFDIWDIVIEPWSDKNGVEWANPPAHQGVRFVESVLRRAEAHAMIANGLNKSFDVKYFYGAPRPYEYSDYNEVLEMYPCPAHPEKPAGHGAFCGAGSKAFRALFKATPEQLQIIDTATKQFAMFRTFSAMHIASSNLLGWKIGFES